MGRFKDKMMDEEQEFWGDCIDMMKESECIQEFWGRYNAAEKDGSIQRPEHISMTELEEQAGEAWQDLWADYITPLT